MQTFLRKSLDVMRAEGFAALLGKAVRKFRLLLYQTNDAEWLNKDLRDVVESQAPDVSARVIFSSREKVVAWMKENSSRYPWIYIEAENYIACIHDHVYPFIVHNNEIVGYIKIGMKRVYIDDFKRFMRIPDKNAFIYDTFILPNYRGKHMGSFLLASVLEYLRMHGYERVWCHIPKWNTASLKLYEGAGFQKISHIKFVKLMSFRFYNFHPEKIMRKI